MRGKGIFKRLTAALTALLIAVSAVPGIEFVSAVDIDPIVHVADTPTLDGWRDVFMASDMNTGNAGGIWVDKSVFDTDMGNISLSDENNFLVSLSAIASTKSITGYSYIPTDTVLVLDISGSMFSSTTNQTTAQNSKAARMIEAANQAIKSLLANNNNNRVGVVLYSSSGMEFLPIDRYSVTDPETDNYLEYEFITQRQGRTTTYTGIRLVTGDTLEDGDGNSVSEEVTVTGGTYIQAGIEFAGDYLTSTDTTVEGGSFQAGVTRMPIIVLMSDGAATYGTASYTDVTNGERGGPGNGDGNTGLAFVNQLTAIYTMKRIEEHYGRNALLYTLGVGVNDTAYAMSVLNPSSPNASDDVADLWTLYDRLGGINNTLSVELGGRSNSEQSVSKYSPATVGGFTISSADRFYVDRYFSASTASDITAAFQSIVDQIIIQSKYYPTYVTDGDHHLDGDITFKDEIGRYMEVKEVKGVLLGDVLFSGEAVAKAMNEGDLGTIEGPTPLGDELSRAVQKRIGVDVATAQFLIDEAYNSGQLYYDAETGEYSNYIGWYADANGDYVGFWNGDGEMSDRPANAVYANRSYGFMGVTGTGINASDMMYLSVQVHTTIDTKFSAVIFKIPSALIPLISYEVSLEGTSYEDATDVSVTRSNANPIRLVYEVGLRSDVNELTIKDVVDEAYPYVDANGIYSFYTNRWVTDATQEHNENHHPDEHLNTVAYYTPSEENERYYYTENTIVYSDTNGTVYTGDEHPASTGDTYYRAYYVFFNNADNDGIRTSYEQIYYNAEDASRSTLSQAEWDAENGYWYIPKGYIHRTTGSFFVSKSGNNSGTYTFVRQPVVGMYNGTFYATAFLGNNGLLTLEPAQGIKISKELDTTAVPGTNTEFTFSIASSNASDNSEYRVIRFDAEGNETNETIQFTAGGATIDLNVGEEVYILDLAEGDTFTVTELKHEDYRVKSVNGDETATSAEVTVVKHEIADADFVNTYIPKGLLVVSKTVEHTLSDEFAIDADREYDITVALGAELADSEFDAVIENADGTTENTKVKADANGNIALSLAHGSNIAIEDIPEGTVYTVTEADYSASGFTTAINAPTGTIVGNDNSYVSVVNTYTPDGVDLSAIIHTGTKAIDGREWLDTDTFEFVLEKFTGTGYTKVGESIIVTYSDVTDEVADFGFSLADETLTDIGEYRYKVREVAGEIGGMTYTDVEYEFTVTVTDETMDGKLEIASVTSATATVTQETDTWTVETPFTNTYRARGGAEVSVTVNKTVANDDGTVNTELSLAGYQFGIYDENGQLIDTLTTDANGVATGSRTYTVDAIGEIYTYVIREINTGIPGIVYSLDEHIFTVEVIDNLDGTIGAEIKESVQPRASTPGITVSYVNTYKPAAIILEGTKVLNNRDMIAGEFKFEVKEGDTVVATGQNTADGRIIFTEIDYTDIGTHNYIISEVTGSNETITYDTDSVAVTVDVTANADGSLIATLAENSPAIEFENTYNLAETSIVLKGAKSLTGRDLTEGEFTFEVEENGTVVAYGTNDVNGEITFDAIEYAEPGVHIYTIKEVNSGKTINGVTYDADTITITVNVVDNGDGTMTASVSDTSPEIKFENTYGITEGDSITFTGTKTLTGKDMTAGQFEFVVMEGETKVAEGTNAADGTIIFDEIEYTEAGTHAYTITEVNGGETIDGITYDADTITITVNVVDNGDGTLTASVDSTSPAIKFENTYGITDGDSITLTGTKTLTGKDMTAGQFEFVVMEGNTRVAEGTNAADGTIIFDEIEYTEAGTHAYTITEVNGGETIAGIKYDDATITVTVNVVDNGDGTLTASLATGSSAIAFENTYGITEGDSITLTGTKTLEGKDLTAGQFEFVVMEGNKKVAEGTNDAKGNIVFDEITYAEAGTHTYTITEVNGGETIDGITYDADAITVTVNVVDNGDGTLTASLATGSSAIAFENTYGIIEGDSITLTGTKTLTGKDMTAGQFEFVVMEGNTKVAEGTNAADGTIIFDEIEYTEAGTHTYVISEVNGGETIDGITYDADTITITVNVVDNGDGTLTASVDSTSPAIKFENTYGITDGDSITLTGTKTLTGKDMTAGQFEFVVMEGETKVAEGTNAADGTITFDEIEYTEAGTHTYTITEVNGGETIDGIKYDADAITVTVNVVDNGDGTLTASVEGAPTIEFTNTYGITDGDSITLTGTKTLTGKDMTAGQFEFVVMEGETKVAEGTNDAKGNIVFDEITYTEAGTHTYVISEVNGGETIDGITYDADAITVTVNVVDNGDGTLTASVEGAPTIEFTNTYGITDGDSITLTGTKTLTGKDMTAGQFEFVVMEGETKVAEGTNDANGVITFDEITYAEAGTHTYTITEVNGGQTIAGIKYDDAEITVTVNVVDNGDGTLTASLATGSPAIAFENTYSTSGEATITLEGTKTLKGREMENGEFEFEVKEGDTVVATGENTADGEIVFETITYTATGTHTYTVYEVKGGDKEITYDDMVYTVVVNVTDNGDGTLSAKIEDGAPDIVFENTYTYIDDNAYLTLEATKIYRNGTLKGDDFSFELKDENGEVLQTVTNDADGDVVFDTITYTAEGGPYVYTISEVIGGLLDTEYDRTVYTLTVNVTAQTDGKLVADVVITNEDDEELEEIIFVNVYEKQVPQTPIDANINIRVTKQIVDKTGDGYDLDGFVFVLKNLTTGQTYTATSDAVGYVSFALGFTTAEIGNIYEYEITEANTGIEGMEYDTSAHHFTIKVTYIPPINKVDAYITKDGKTVTGVMATFINTYNGIDQIDPPDDPEDEPEEAIFEEEEF